MNLPCTYRTPGECAWNPCHHLHQYEANLHDDPPQYPSSHPFSVDGLDGVLAGVQRCYLSLARLVAWVHWTRPCPWSLEAWRAERGTLLQQGRENCMFLE